MIIIVIIIKNLKKLHGIIEVAYVCSVHCMRIQSRRNPCLTVVNGAVECVCVCSECARMAREPMCDVCVCGCECVSARVCALYT